VLCSLVEFKLYTAIGGSCAGQDIPPQYMTFESKKYQGFFMTWDSPNTGIKLKVIIVEL